MSLRYAHSEGHTDICYSEDSNYIITCGSEGDVRIWAGVEDADQKDVCVGDKAWSVFQKGINLYVGTDTNIIQAYTFPDLEPDGIITRFTSPATQIDIAPDGSKLAASSSDMNVHVVDLNSMECKKLTGHRAPVLSVSLDPKLEFVASSSCDGTVRIWALSSGDVVKQWEVVPKSNAFETSSVLCRLHFDLEGRNVAIPIGETVKLYRRETWVHAMTLSSSGNNVINIVKFSPCGKFIAGGSTCGKVFIWSLITSNIIEEDNSSRQAICGIAWCASKSIVFVNANGQLGSLQLSNFQENDIEKEEIDPGNIPLGEPELVDDDDDDNVISLGKIKAETGFGENGEILRSVSPVDEVDERSSVVESVIRSKVNITEPQGAFQPSSTPVHLQQRYMVWNNVGIIRQFNMEDMNDIDIEFHDTSLHHGVRMNNLLGHTIATLTEKLAVFGSPKTEDGPSKLVCILLKAWDGQKEWDCSFGEEEIVLISAGDGWVAVATDISTLHLFSADGTQTDLVSLPGRPVSIAGHKEHLCVITNCGIGLHGDQSLFFIEFKIDPLRRLLKSTSPKPLPLSCGSSLRWIGYTDEGSLVTVDYVGVLRILYKSVWRPVCNLDKQCKSEYDHFFVIGLSELSQNVRCILCKGTYYPPVTPKPLVAEIKWKIPMCELDSDKSQLEEDLLRTVITIPNLPSDQNEEKRKIEKNISVVIMKLFALACRSGLDSRAISLCETMPSIEVVKLAAKYAAKLGKHHLAEKVTDIANKMSKVSFIPEIPEENSDTENATEPENDNYSQDMFGDNEAKENLILKLKKKKEQMSPKPLRIRRNENPFKKAKEEVKVASDGNTSVAEPKMNFLDWYDNNRSRLQEDHPLLKEGELAMAGMKLYKQEKTIKTTLNQSVEDIDKNDIPPPEPELSKKRKISPENSNVSNKKLNVSSKLKSFSFSKR
ncbi:unnamed protein product [Nezara viridula]|uniref:WD repeat and HMG-box DNA-binding protein 1 n=1 Tax=Nezara viridula TaxID=85310 RepID=A0A9P0HHN3_NEZVI|nr:unnamed protein product [Nezara viridula]